MATLPILLPLTFPLERLSATGNEVSMDTKPKITLLTHLVIASPELQEVNESGMNQPRAGLALPHLLVHVNHI